MTINYFNNNLLYNMLYMFTKKTLFPKEKVEWEELYYFTLYKSL